MKVRKPAPNQQTFAEINGISKFHSLTDNQRRILSLVNCHVTQAEIAKKLKFSPSYVCQTIKRLQSFNLIKKLETQRTKEGEREYNNFYELSPELKNSIKKEVEQIWSPFRTHHLLRKFHIVNQSGAVSIDKRASWSKSKNLRGGARHSFWYPGKAGLPSVTIEVHPKTLVAWIDKGQQIVARTKEEAEQLGWFAIMQAKEKFIEQQQLFGITFEIETVGQQIGKTHQGLAFRDDGPFAQKETSLPGFWIDQSVEKELGPGYSEIECHGDHALATPLEKGIMAISALPETIRAAMPEALRELEKVGPLTSEVHQVLAHIQGGLPLQNQVDQLTIMMAKSIEKYNQIIEIIASQKTGNKKRGPVRYRRCS